MKYQPALVQAKLIRRYKRFLADVMLPSGEVITIHCPNTGSMKNCIEEGAGVWMSRSDNAKRKYAHTWELTRSLRGHYIGINTGKANQLVADAIRDGTITELQTYDVIKPEVRYGSENSRIDLLLQAENRRDCYVEVKSVTLLETPVSAGRGFFPDSVSTRGLKHLRELALMVKQGRRAVLVYCVQHSGILSASPAAHIDPNYAATLAEVMACGVEVLAYKCRMGTGGVKITRSLEVCSYSEWAV